MSYNAESIKHLSDREHCRLRPGMYISGVGPEGVHHLFLEILDNAIDEYLAGHANRIDVVYDLGTNCLSVSDNGRGIPIEIHSETGTPTAISVASSLRSGGKFDNETYSVSSGLHGVGLAVVNFLSQQFWLHSNRGSQEGALFAQFERGILFDQRKEPCNKRGTTIVFTPDPEIFKSPKFDDNKIKERLIDLSYLCPRLNFSFTEVDGKTDQFYQPQGLSDWLVQQTGSSQGKVFNVIHDNQNLKLGLVYIDKVSEKIVSFVNCVKTASGGSHVFAFKKAIKNAAIRAAMEIQRLSVDEELDWYDISEGLYAIIDLRLPNPMFEGQNKTKFYSEELSTLFKHWEDKATQWFIEDEQGLFQLNRIIDNYRARERAKLAASNKSVKRLKSNVLAGKLADASSKKRYECELYLVEGNSAAGSCKSARDSKTQAILPLRGKVLNVERAIALEKVKSNVEISILMMALGIDIQNPKPEDLNYGKVIIATDADPDGRHIETLLITLFYRYFRMIIEDGHLYVADNPLYRLSKAGKIVYLRNDEELATFDTKGWIVQRFKGLGEMDKGDVYDTLMNPATRVIKQITVDDAQEISLTISNLFGSDAAFRRQLFSMEL